MDHNSHSIGLFIGIDWADREHEVFVIDPAGHSRRESLKQCPEAINAWVSEKLRQAKGADIAILLEKHRGGLLHALMNRDKVRLYLVNPKQAAKYRESYSNAGGKCDRVDARLLAGMLRERYTILQPWEPDDQQTRLIGRLCEVRRGMVDDRTKCVQRLTAHIKAYFPLLLELGGGKVTSLVIQLARRWPDPRKLKRARPDTIRKVLSDVGCKNQERQSAVIKRIRESELLTRDEALIQPEAVLVKSLVDQHRALESHIKTIEQQISEAIRQHPDAELFQSLPGAGEQIAPRLLAAFGSQRDRFESADAVAAFSGIAPVTKQSGRSKVVVRRYAASKFLRQTFHEFAGHAAMWCPWSKAYYRMQSDRGMKHHAILRKLAYRWIRILFKVWKTHTPYDPQLYRERILARNPAIRPYLLQPPTTT